MGPGLFNTAPSYSTPVKGNPAFLGAEGGAMYQILWELGTGMKEEDN